MTLKNTNTLKRGASAPPGGCGGDHAAPAPLLSRPGGRGLGPAPTPGPPNRGVAGPRTHPDLSALRLPSVRPGFHVASPEGERPGVPTRKAGRGRGRRGPRAPRTQLPGSPPRSADTRAGPTPSPPARGTPPAKAAPLPGPGRAPASERARFPTRSPPQPPAPLGKDEDAFPPGTPRVRRPSPRLGGGSPPRQVTALRPGASWPPSRGAEPGGPRRPEEPPGSEGESGARSAGPAAQGRPGTHGRTKRRRRLRAAGRGGPAWGWGAERVAPRKAPAKPTAPARATSRAGHRVPLPEAGPWFPAFPGAVLPLPGGAEPGDLSPRPRNDLGDTAAGAPAPRLRRKYRVAFTLQPVLAPTATAALEVTGPPRPETPRGLCPPASPGRAERKEQSLAEVRGSPTPAYQ
nr:collagen alpha-1(I) chain-like [Dasypus novemcinctus]